MDTVTAYTVVIDTTAATFSALAFLFFWFKAQLTAQPQAAHNGGCR